jgi:hypothetical protein
MRYGQEELVLFQRLGQALTLDGEREAVQRLRALAAGHAGHAGDEEVRRAAGRRSDRYGA